MREPVNRLVLKETVNREPTLPRPALSATERVYNSLGELLDRTQNKLEILTALALRLGVDLSDAEAFERAVQAIEAAQEARQHAMPQADEAIGIPVNGLDALP